MTSISVPEQNGAPKTSQQLPGQVIGQWDGALIGVQPPATANDAGKCPTLDPAGGRSPQSRFRVSLSLCRLGAPRIWKTGADQPSVLASLSSAGAETVVRDMGVSSNGRLGKNKNKTFVTDCTESARE